MTVKVKEIIETNDQASKTDGESVELKNLKIKEFISEQTIKELKDLTFYEIEKVEGKIPYLSAYSKESLRELSYCEIIFSSRSNKSTGEESYVAVCNVKPGLQVIFKSNSFRKYRYGDLDNISYNRAFLLAKNKLSGTSIRDKFVLPKCYYRIDFGYSVKDQLYAKFSVVVGPTTNSEGAPNYLILSQFISIAYVKDLAYNDDWTSGENPVKAYFVGKTEENPDVFDEEEDLF